MFELDYGRMNSTLGVELPLTNILTQTTIPLGFIDPPTEYLKDGEMQLWKITHNGVDTHAIHFHLFDVQLINRVDWAGVIKPPDANEVGWKDTVRMNPLEDAIVALRPVKQNLPWPIPDSIRPLDPTMPIGSTMGFTNVDPATGNPITVTNQLTNYGREYVWHCHLLGHEEMDMMRPIVFQVAPETPTNLTAVISGRGVLLTWTDASRTATTFNLQRATNAAFTTGVTTRSLGVGVNPQTYTDTAVLANTTYYYQVQAISPNGISAWSTPVSITTGGPPAAAKTLTASAAGAHQVNLAWAYTAGANAATGFRVERAVGAGFFVTLTTVAPTATTYNDTTAPDATALQYRVIAFNVWGDAAPSNVASITLPLAAPVNLTAALSPQPPLRVTVAWANNSVVATAFAVQRATDATFTQGVTSFAPGANLTITDTTAQANRTYYYRVRATFGATTSAWTGPVALSTAPPPAPTAFTATASATANNTAQVVLNWQENAPVLGGFTLQRSTNSSFALVRTSFALGPGARTFTDTGLRRNTRYYYRVQALNGAGSSNWTTLNVTTPR